MATLTDHVHPVDDFGYQGAFSPDGKTLAITRRLTATLTDPHSEGVNAVTLSPDGKTLATGDGNGKIYLWDVG
jgi:WD40 repeat protein